MVYLDDYTCVRKCYDFQKINDDYILNVCKLFEKIRYQEGKRSFPVSEFLLINYKVVFQKIEVCSHVDRDSFLEVVLNLRQQILPWVLRTGDVPKLTPV